MLFDLFLGISVLVAIVLTVTGTFSLPVAILAFIGIFVAFNALFVLFLFLVSLLFPPREEKERGSAFCRTLTSMTMDWILRIFRVRTELCGAKLLPEEPFILVSNHLSRFDPMVTVHALRRKKLVFISKKENMAIPIAGRILHRAGYISLDRENPLRAMRALRRAAEMVKNGGFSVGIYPEGTRSKNGELLPFKSGAFVLAQKANVPVLLMTVENTPAISARFRFFPAKVRIRVLDVIPAETVRTLKPEALAELCRGRLAAALPHKQ